MLTNQRQLRPLSSSIATWLLLVASVVGCSASSSSPDGHLSLAGESGNPSPSIGGATSTGDSESSTRGGTDAAAASGGADASIGGGPSGVGGTGGTISSAMVGAASGGSSRASGGSAPIGPSGRGGSAQGGRTQLPPGNGGNAQAGLGPGSVAQGGVLVANGGRSPVGFGGRTGTGQAGRGVGGAARGGAAQGGSAVATAGSTGVSSATAQEYVDAVNAIRAAVTEPANYSGTWAPLPNVTWSDKVAASAQAWADNLAATKNCGLTHEGNTGYGENLAAGTNLSPTAAVNLWAGEKDLYTYSPKYTQADFDKGSGHYTQLVWRKSIEIGCGSATCGRTVVISCRFNPPGNYMGQPVY